MSGKLERRGPSSWRLRYDLDPDASGMRQRRSATFKGTRKEAEAQTAKLLASVAAGVDIGISTLRRSPSPITYAHGFKARMAFPPKRTRDISSLLSNRSFRTWEG
jgi:hypothetical protein